MKTKYLTRLALLVSLVAGPLAFAQKPADKATPEEELKTEPAVKTEVVVPAEGTVVTEPAVIEGSLTDLVGDSVTFSTLTAALKATGLDVTLGGKDVFTLFAPTDEAFDKLPAGMLGKLMLPENKEKLRALLLYHVVPGKVLAADLKDGEVTTMNGEKVKVDVDDDKIEINDAKVFSTDVAATNGVMHSIGNVMFPKSLEGFTPFKN